MKPVPARDIIKEKDKLKIKFDEEAGRYAVALEDIEIGDIIVKDAPTACSLKYGKILKCQHHFFFNYFLGWIARTTVTTASSILKMKMS